MASLLPEPAPLQMGPPGTGLSPYALMQNRRPPLDPRLGYPRMYSTTATTVTAPMLVNPAEEGAGGLSTNSFGVNAADGEGRTALHWAAVTEQPAMVHLLLRAGASHDVQTAHEETPLTLAAREGSVDVCSILLAAGANIEIADYLDRTPRQLAAQNGHTEVVQLLQVFSTAPPPNPGQHHFARRTYTQPFFPQQQQTMPSCYYRGVPVTTTVGSVYSEGQTYEKRTKYEPPDFPNVGSGESFLMQLAPTTSSASGANTTTTESSKTFFFDQPPQYPGLNSMTKSSGVYGGAENCWALRNQPAATNNGHTPSSDTESPAHWSSPSPTAISPPVPPPKMTVATSGHYQVAPSSATHTTLPCCPSHQVTENYAAAAPASGGFTVSYAAAVDDCIKLEPRVF
ncbi:unnamed protein product [Mesocestoides corti]|uniref:ANK_REP_REGION domain-containing protein n=1 Tax=Mesocestoides corti TaxID=53468 RepID=A0A0R3UK81_MESCO|nr:unnamed protein product [Mesocestoides corti]